ncbi:MAG: MarR family transcriptional regulator [Acidimicrobiia bacterium]
MGAAAGWLRIGPGARGLRKALRPIEWMVLEEVALDADLDGDGRLVAPTSARRVAENLGLTPGAVSRALGHLRTLGLVDHVRQAGAGGHFGLSLYVLAPVAGMAVEPGWDQLTVDADAPSPVSPAATVDSPSPEKPWVAKPDVVGTAPVKTRTAVGTAADASVPVPVTAAASSKSASPRGRGGPAGATGRRRRGTDAATQLDLLSVEVPDSTKRLSR